MKKIAFAALAIALVGGNAFAEDPAIKVSGYVNQGVKIVNADDVTTIQNYGLDWDDVGTWATLGAEYTGEKSGFNVTVDVTNNTDAGSVLIDTAYGWMSPVEGFKLFAGTSYSGVFDAVDDNGADYFSSTGFSAVYTISGFTLGAGATVETDATTHSDTVFGVAYALDKVVDARFSALVDGAEGKLDSFSATASFPVVENLTLIAGVYGEGQGDETTATNGFDATVGYKVGALAGQVVTYYTFENEDFVDKGVVSPTLAKLTIAPRVTYQLTPELKVYAQDKFVLVDSEFTTQVIRLQAAYTVDSASSITVRGEYDTDAEKTTAYVDYVFSF